MQVDTRGAGDAGALAVQLLHTTAWGKLHLAQSICGDRGHILLYGVMVMLTGELDYLIIDTPPGTGEVPRALAARAHLSGAVVVTTPSALATADVVRGVAMLTRFSVPVLALVENMSSFKTHCGSCGHEHEHFPFGYGHLDTVLESMEPTGSQVSTLRLPIAADHDPTQSPSKSALASKLDALAATLEAEIVEADPVQLPQLAWHERPSWKDKLFFASRGAERRLDSDREFKITPR